MIILRHGMLLHNESSNVLLTTTATVLCVYARAVRRLSEKLFIGEGVSLLREAAVAKEEVTGDNGNKEK